MCLCVCVCMCPCVCACVSTGTAFWIFICSPNMTCRTKAHFVEPLILHSDNLPSLSLPSSLFSFYPYHSTTPRQPPRHPGQPSLHLPASIRNSYAHLGSVKPFAKAWSLCATFCSRGLEVTSLSEPGIRILAGCQHWRPCFAR